MLAAPVSGNPKVAKSGKLSLVVSGPRDAYEEARPYLELLGHGVTYVGEGEIARLNNKLQNPGFVQKAPAKVVEEEKQKLVKYTDMLAKVNDRLKTF
jgi:3-hydroxyisobutyrate dehydrogenase-like beta-hydroxyacid dehydrogenase